MPGRLKLGVWLLLMWAFSAGPAAAQSRKRPVELVIYGATIYTMEAKDSLAQAMAVDHGIIIDIGSTEHIRANYKAKKEFNAKKLFVYPGFYDSHCHFLAYSNLRDELILYNVRSEKQLVQAVRKFPKSKYQNGWILGRGWNEELWKKKGPITNEALNKAFPDVPVYLSRVDGHAALVNDAALKLAGITIDTRIPGGIIETVNGRPSGILIDKAAEKVRSLIPPPDIETVADRVKDAQMKCLAAGLTTVTDAGLTAEQINQLLILQDSGLLQIRINGMLIEDDPRLDEYLMNNPIRKEWVRVGAVKSYGDGSLGSRGAMLLKPYSDNPKMQGMLLHETKYYVKLAQKVAQSEWQLNTHCIGDSCNRLISRLYRDMLSGAKNRRWRIEHCQVVDSNDLINFKLGGIIPSIQPTHATSDALMAPKRLGSNRLNEAYPYKALLNTVGKVAIGSDFPVESISPIDEFYAAVFRLNPYKKAGKKDIPFLPNNALSRRQALLGLTLWAAYADFEENEKGSLAVGKKADFIILDSDLKNDKMEKIRKSKVKATFVAGILRFGKIKFD